MIIDKAWLYKGAFSVGNNLLNVGIRFFTFFIIVRGLNKDNFGIWAIFLIVTSILEVMRNGFIKNGLIKFLAPAHLRHHGRIQTASLLLNLLITGASILLLQVCSTYMADFWHADALISMFKWYSLTAFILVFLSHLEFVGTTFYKFEHIFWINATKNSTFLALVVFTNFYGSINLISLVIFQSIAALAGCLIGFFLLKPVVKYGKIIVLRWIYKLFHFGKYVVGTNLGSMIYSSADQLLLGAILSTQAVATYNTAIRINNFIDAPVMGISNIFYPQLASKGSTAFKDIYLRSVGLILSLLIPLLVGIYFLADYVILLIAGPNYADSATILRVTILYTLFVPFARQFGSLLDAVGKPHINLMFTTGSTIINIGASYFFIIKFGVIGAAYGTLVTHSLGFLVMHLYLSKHYHIKISEVFKSIVEYYIISIKGILKYVRIKN